MSDARARAPPQVWSMQEKRKLGEVRAVAHRIERENSLLSALQKRVPYKEVLQAARIDFLRKELHSAKGRDADAQNLARSMEAVRMEKQEQHKASIWKGGTKQSRIPLWCNIFGVVVRVQDCGTRARATPGSA